MRAAAGRCRRLWRRRHRRPPRGTGGLNSVAAALAGANSDNVFHRSDENFTVADTAGLRGLLNSLNGALLDDPRVEINRADVARIIQEAETDRYDAILLDVDNGPSPVMSSGIPSLYSRTGIRAIGRVLKQDGRIVVWSAGQDQGFEKRLGKAGFRVEAVPAKAHKGAKGASYLIYLADLNPSRP